MIPLAFFIITTALCAFFWWRSRLTIDLLRGDLEQAQRRLRLSRRQKVQA